MDEWGGQALGTYDPEAGRSYGSFGEVSSLVVHLFMVVSDEESGNMVRPADDKRVLLLWLQLWWSHTSSNSKKSVRIGVKV